jgi:hypothetical protein
VIDGRPVTAGSITPTNIFWFLEARTGSEESSLPIHLISAVMTEFVVVVIGNLYIGRAS